MTSLRGISFFVWRFCQPLCAFVFIFSPGFVSNRLYAQVTVPKAMTASPDRQHKDPKKKYKIQQPKWLTIVDEVGKKKGLMWF